MCTAYLRTAAAVLAVGLATAIAPGLLMRPDPEMTGGLARTPAATSAGAVAVAQGGWAPDWND